MIDFYPSYSFLLACCRMFLLAIVFFGGHASASEIWITEYPKVAADWFQAGANKVEQKAASNGLQGKGKARNVILFVGDGMGISTITAARIFAGQQQGLSGEGYELAFDKFPYSGLTRTYNTNMQTPDSAGTMTAIVTGVKTKAGVLSVSDAVLKGDCRSGRGNALLTALELAELAGLSTGIISTARITHATPAATYAHTVDRDWENDRRLPQTAKQLQCQDIASQLLAFESNLKKYLHSLAFTHKIDFTKVAEIDGPDIILGGGMKNFLPKKSVKRYFPGDSKMTGARGDDRNLVDEWLSKYSSAQFVATEDQLEEAVLTDNKKILGLFSGSHMAYEAQRRVSIAASSQPSLATMTAHAIDRLSKNKQGYFLMVEAGRIDHAHHAGNAYNALSDTVALSQAVDVALEKTAEHETLIIVTADHSHVFTMGGYPQRGNPILGKVISPDAAGLPQKKYSLDAEGRPYTTLGYMNGRGFAHYPIAVNADKRYEDDIYTGRKDLREVDTQLAGYHQEALVPMDAETHGGEDVAVYARGPGAYLFSGSYEQNVVFHALNFAAELTLRAQNNVSLPKPGAPASKL